MSNYEYRNPIVGSFVTAPNSIQSLEDFYGSNFSVYNIGGYMEVWSLSDLDFITNGQTGNIRYSGNTIPVLFNKASTSNLPDSVVLYNDGISSGRRRIGMLVYVHETQTTYQYQIDSNNSADSYENMWSAATAVPNIVDFSSAEQITVKNRTGFFQPITQVGQDLIDAWTGSTVEGVNGVSRDDAKWRIFWGTDWQVTGGTVDYNSTGDLRLSSNSGNTVTISGLTTITGGTYLSGTSTLELYNNLGDTVSVTGFTGGGGTSGSSGSSGTSGESGTSGSSGSSGTSGESGTSGSSGSSGTSGSSGSSGTSGESGTSGSSGSSGTSGSSGSSGTSGNDGAPGTSGSSGSSGTSGTATITNLGDNRVLTSTGTQGEANAEANLTFNNSTLGLTGDLEITGDIVTSGNNNIVIDPGGTGSITLKSDNIIMEGAGTTTVPELRLGEWTGLGSDYVGFKPPLSVTTSTVWTLPDGDGTANQGLATDGSDTLVWKDFILETNPVVEGTITVKPVGPSVQPAKILLKDFDNSNGITIQVPTNVTTDYSLTLPADDGTSGQVLSTDGSGVLSWVTGGSGTSGSSGSSGTSGTATINNNADNRIITGSATAGELNAESSLTFDGSFLDVSGRIQLQNSHGASNPSIQDTTGDYGLAIATNSTVSLVAGGSAKISMTSSGIEIFSTMDMNLNKIAFDSDSTNSYIAANTDNPEDIEIHADEDILLMADGQVGIKTTTPAYDLDVAGSIGLTGDITGNGSTLKVSEIASAIGAASAAGDKGINAETYTAYSTTVIAGGIYYLGTSAWTISDADAASSATGLMGVATSTNSNTGMVIRGVVGVFSDPGGSVGDVCYLSTTSGRLTTTAPTAAGDIVRVMGYKIGTNLVFFNPSNDWIEL